MSGSREPGGFILSPPLSLAASSTIGTHATLPNPRSSPLKPGGSKESAFIRFVDQRVLHIQRRFAKRTTPSSQLLSDIDRDKADGWHDVKGYASMREACKDVEDLLEVIWVSGTPGLQVAYLISLALLLTSVISGMPPSPKNLFRVLNKLDLAFASLVQGCDVETGDTLPGFGNGRGIGDTEKVRIRSLIERTRVATVEVFKRGEFEYESIGEDESTDEAKMSDALDEDGLILENPSNDMLADDESDSWDMQIAKVYDRTMVELGSSLEEPSIGLITERRY